MRNTAEARKAAEFLASYDYGLAGLDDAMPNMDDSMLEACHLCGFDGLGAFVGQKLTPQAVSDARKVVAAAAQPASEQARAVSGRMARKGLELGKIAHDRAQVALKARKKRDELASRVERLQPAVDRFLASASPADRARGEAMKMDQYSAARAAVRLDKVNAIATGLAQNAAAQAVIAQQIAASVAGGKPALTATLTDMFNKLGQSSASMQKVREQQVVKSANVLDQDKVRALLARKRNLLLQKVDVEVLLTCDAPNGSALRKQLRDLYAQIEMINAEVRKLCTGRVRTALDLQGLEGLEGLEGSESNPDNIAQDGRNIVAWLWEATKAKQLGKSPSDATARDAWWGSLPASGGSNSRQHFRFTVKAILGRSPNKGNNPAKDLAWWDGLSKDRRVQMRNSYGAGGQLTQLSRSVKSVAKPIVSVAESAVKTAILPATTAVKLVTKGPSAAIGNVTKVMKDSFNTVRKAAGQVFVGLPCKLASSTVGKAVMQIGASAVGTAVGGPVGTVAGAVAANRAADLTKSVCGGLDKIGLTSGDFRTSKLGAALKQTAMSIGKNLTDPKKLLRDVSSAGTALVGGSGVLPTDLLNKVGGEQLRKLGIDAIAKNIGLPGGAGGLLKAAGIPTNVTGVLKAAGLPSGPQDILRAVGVPTNVKSALRAAGVPSDLPSLVKATHVLDKLKLPPTAANIAKAMNVQSLPIPGLPGQFRLPSQLPSYIDVAQMQQQASRRIASVRQAETERQAASQARVSSLVNQALMQPAVAFAAGSPAAQLLKYV